MKTKSRLQPIRNFGKRPKWAKSLNRQDWRHLQDGQQRNMPTLSNLRLDAETCPDCRWLLQKVTKNGGAK
jgi:hypothetical protein